MKLEYTLHSVAWPTAKLDKEWHTDELLVSSDEGNEIKWTFMTFDGGTRGVQFSVFGDGLAGLFDPRIVAVLAQWSMVKPDEITPQGLIALLEAQGITASEYHMRNVT